MQSWLEPIEINKTLLIPEIIIAEVTIPWINTEILKLFVIFSTYYFRSFTSWMYLEKFNGFTSEGRAELQDNRGFDEDSEFRELNRTNSVQVGSAPCLYRKLSCQKKCVSKNTFTHGMLMLAKCCCCFSIFFKKSCRLAIWSK